MSTYSPLITPEDITQERELMRLTRPERFRKWTVSRASVTNELLRREHGRRLNRPRTEPMNEAAPPVAPERAEPEIRELRRDLARALESIPEEARRIAGAIYRGERVTAKALGILRGELRARGLLGILTGHL